MQLTKLVVVVLMEQFIGNMPTEQMISYFNSKKADSTVKPMPFESAHNQATILFSKYH